jgi:hypothetical protein
MSNRKVFPVLKSCKKKLSYQSPRNAAKRLKVSLPTIYKWCHDSIIKDLHKDSTGHWLIPISFVKPSVPEWHYTHPSQLKKRKKKKAIQAEGKS